MFINAFICILILITMGLVCVNISATTAKIKQRRTQNNGLLYPHLSQNCFRPLSLKKVCKKHGCSCWLQYAMRRTSTFLMNKFFTQTVQCPIPLRTLSQSFHTNYHIIPSIVNTCSELRYGGFFSTVVWRTTNICPARQWRRTGPLLIASIFQYANV
jgi:hypothetical protein